MNTDQQIN